MIRRLLVPLDGSRLAESALSTASVLAEKLNLAVNLVHVIEKNARPSIHGDRHLTQEDESCRYLDEMAQKYFGFTDQVECHVHNEDVRSVAQGISMHATEFDSDLIVMCAHGGGGVRDWVVGSIAQQVISMGQTPILLLRPVEHQEIQPPVLRRFLVALDANLEHEKGLQLAAELAQNLTVELDLVHVIPTTGTLKGERAITGRLLPGATGAMLDMTEAYAQQYLDERAAPLRASGLQISTAVFRGDPAGMISEAGRKLEADWIILGTHGRAGMGAFWAGSTAPAVYRSTHIPLLLVPVQHPSSESGSSD
jgi:nucleotide-binding universal stress UspA family protein